MNPYEVLGVSENATKDEIKSAYRKLVKQYHPDQYVNNPLKDLAAEKLTEINKAYEMLMSNTSSSYNSNSSSSTYSSSSSDYAVIRRYINARDLANAERMLNNISNRDAEWYFLSGAIAQSKGWFDQARQNYSTACNMDPNNFEYRKAYNNLVQRTTTYSGPYRQYGNSSTNACNCCCDLICLDSCCECMGGDIIPCI